MTPAAMGTDNIAVQIFSSSTPIKLADSKMLMYGPKMIYGLTDDWDLIAKLGNVTTNLSGNDSSATDIGIAGKYTIPRSKFKTPADVDLAAVIGYDLISGKDIDWTMTSVGLIGSKTLKTNLDVYAALYYMMNNNKFTGGRSENSNNSLWGLGAKYQFNKKFSGLMEIMNYLMSGDAYQTFSFAVQYEMQ
jgi:hypothetical protein